MRPRALLAAVLLPAMLAARPALAASGDEGKDRVAVRLEGASAFPAKTVLDTVGVKPSTFGELFRRPARVPRADLEAKLGQVRLFYQRRGYFEVTATLEMKGEKEAVFKVAEGAPCRVASVTVLLAADASPGGLSLDALRGGLPLKEGAVFTVAAYEAAAQAILGRLKEDGRPFARVQPEAVVDLSAHTVAVTYTLRPDHRLVVGGVTFSGAAHVDETVLRRAVRLHPDEPYRQSAADASRDALYRLGLFNSVVILPRRGSRPGTVDLAIRVTEGLQRRVRVGVGYGTDEGPRGQVRWETLRFANRAVVLGTEVKASNIESRVTGFLRRPYVFDERTTLLADLSVGSQNEQDFRYRSLKAQAGFQRDFTDRLQGGAFLVLERVLQFTPNRSLDDALSSGARQVVTMASLPVTATYRTTDDPLAPTRGMMASAFLEPTGVLADGTFFTRAVLEDRHFIGLSRSVVLALRLKVGAILTGAPEGAVPLTRRFYAGGSNSVRGYAYDSLGPLSPQGALVGGEGLLEGSVELRFPLRGNLKGVAFVDGGDAFRKPFRYSWDQMYGGAGVGVRYATPVGPVGLDLAWKLRKDPLDPSAYMVHFFIGYAF